MIDRLPANAADALVDVAGMSAQFPLLSVELRHLQGELGRARPQNGALSSIEAKYAMYAVGMVPAPELEPPVRAQVRAVKDTLAPWAARHMYLNFAETPHNPATLWTEQAYHRLRRIKTRVDPDDVIRSNHPHTDKPLTRSWVRPHAVPGAPTPLLDNALARYALR